MSPQALRVQTPEFFAEPTITFSVASCRSKTWKDRSCERECDMRNYCDRVLDEAYLDLGRRKD